MALTDYLPSPFSMNDDEEPKVATNTDPEAAAKPTATPPETPSWKQSGQPPRAYVQQQKPPSAEDIPWAHIPKESSSPTWNTASQQETADTAPKWIPEAPKYEPPAEEPKAAQSPSWAGTEAKPITGIPDDVRSEVDKATAGAEPIPTPTKGNEFHDPQALSVKNQTAEAIKQGTADLTGKVQNKVSGWRTVTAPFERIAYSAAQSFNQGVADFSKNINNIGDFLIDIGMKSTGMKAPEEKERFKSDVFNNMAKSFEGNADYWKKRNDEVGHDAINELIGHAIGGAIPGITDWVMNVPYAALRDAAAEYSKGGDWKNVLMAGAKGAGERILMGQIFHTMGGYSRPVQATGMGAAMAGETFAKGGDLQKVAESFGTGFLYGVTGPGGDTKLRDNFKKPPTPPPDAGLPTDVTGQPVATPAPGEVGKEVPTTTPHDTVANELLQVPEVRDSIKKSYEQYIAEREAAGEKKGDITPPDPAIQGKWLAEALQQNKDAMEKHAAGIAEEAAKKDADASFKARNAMLQEFLQKFGEAGGKVPKTIEDSAKDAGAYYEGTLPNGTHQITDHITGRTLDIEPGVDVGEFISKDRVKHIEEMKKNGEITELGKNKDGETIWQAQIFDREPVRFIEKDGTYEVEKGEFKQQELTMPAGNKVKMNTFVPTREDTRFNSYLKPAAEMTKEERAAEVERILNKPENKTTIKNDAERAWLADEWRVSAEEKAKEIDAEPKRIVEGGSGESAASEEAIRRVQSEKEQGIVRYKIDMRSGKAIPLTTVDAVDTPAQPHETIIKLNKDGTHEIVESGDKAKPLMGKLDGIVAELNKSRKAGEEPVYPEPKITPITEEPAAEKPAEEKKKPFTIKPEEGIPEEQEPRIDSLRKITSHIDKDPKDMTEEEHIRAEMDERYDEIARASKATTVYRPDGTVEGFASGLPEWSRNIIITSKKGNEREADRVDIENALRKYLDTDKPLSDNQKKIVNAALTAAEKAVGDARYEQQRKEQVAKQEDVQTAKLKIGDKFKSFGIEYEVKPGAEEGEIRIESPDGKEYGWDKDATHETVPIEGGEKGITSIEKKTVEGIPPEEPIKGQSESDADFQARQQAYEESLKEPAEPKKEAPPLKLEQETEEQYQKRVEKQQRDAAAKKKAGEGVPQKDVTTMAGGLFNPLDTGLEGEQKTIFGGIDRGKKAAEEPKVVPEEGAAPEIKTAEEQRKKLKTAEVGIAYIDNAPRYIIQTEKIKDGRVRVTFTDKTTRIVDAEAVKREPNIPDDFKTTDKSEVMSKEKAQFGVDKTLLLQTISKDIVNNDLAGTIANETIQNSLDAFPVDQKAKNIDISIDKESGPVEPEAIEKAAMSVFPLFAAKKGEATENVDQVVVTVSDNGSGMTKQEVIDNLMRLGAKGKSGTDTRGGYGLAKAAFILAPIKTEVRTVKNGIETILAGTREQFFGVEGAGDPSIETRRTKEANGSTFKMWFFENEADASKVNAYPMSVWSSQRSFREFISKGVAIEGAKINFKDPYGNKETFKSTSPDKQEQVYPKETVSVKGSELTVYFVKDEKPPERGWRDKYLPHINTYNKGLGLPKIENSIYGIEEMWEQPDFKIIVDFNKTPDVRDINYPFIRNRTELNIEVRKEIARIINDKIYGLNVDKFNKNKAEFTDMVKNSPEIKGVKVLIPFTDKGEFKKSQKMVTQNEELVGDLADVFNSFQGIVDKIGGKKIELAMTVDPKVFGYRSNPEVVGHELYAINPFAVTGNLLTDSNFIELTGKGYNANQAMSSNLVHTLVHEYAHNEAKNHNEDFTQVLSKVYMQMTHTDLAQLEKQTRSFYDKHGETLRNLQADFSKMGESGSKLRDSSLAVYPAGKLPAGIEDRQAVQGVGEEGAGAAGAEPKEIAEKMKAGEGERKTREELTQEMENKASRLLLDRIEDNRSDGQEITPQFILKLANEIYEDFHEGGHDFRDGLTDYRPEERSFYKKELSAIKKFIDKYSSKLPTEKPAEGGVDLTSEKGAVTIPDIIPDVAREKIETVKDYIAKTSESVSAARDIQEGMNTLSSQKKADEIRAVKFIEEHPLPKEDAEAILHYAKEIEVFGKVKQETLTPEQKAYYDEYIKPLQEENGRLYNKIKGYDIDVEPSSDHVTGYVADKGGVFDRIIAGARNVMGGGLLTKSAGFLKRRTVKALTDAQGNRVVASIKNGKVMGFVGGQEKPMGSIKKEEPKRVEEFYDAIVTEKLNTLAAALGISHERTVKSLGAGVAGVSYRGQSRIKTKAATPEAVLLHEIGHQLDERYGMQEKFVKDPALKEEMRALADLRFEGKEGASDYFKKYVRKGSEKIAVMFEAYLQAPEKFKDVAPVTYKAFTDFLGSHPETKPILDIKASLVLGRGVVGEKKPDSNEFIDNTGKKWKIGDPTIKEIEANTNLKYHKNILLNEIVTHNKLNQISRSIDFLESVKEAEDFKKIGMKIGEADIPNGWKQSTSPQFRGYMLDPRVADAIDRFYKKSILQAGDPISFLTGVNNVMRNAIFFNPLIHTPNIANHWAVNRGTVKWFIPKEYGTLLKTAARAIDAVKNQNEDYLSMLDSGANLIYYDVSGKRLSDVIHDSLVKELKENSPLRQHVVDTLGFVTGAKFVKWLYGFSSKVTWATNDIAIMQATYEEMAHGKSLEEAIKETVKHIPDYRIPGRVLDSKVISSIMTNSNLTMFSAYHYGAIKSYGEMAKSMLLHAPPGEKAATIDKLIALGLITLVVYPALDELAKKLSGDKNATVRRAGASTVPHNTYRLVKGKMPITDYIFSILTPSPLLKMGAEFTLNRDVRTGKRIFTETKPALASILDETMKSVSPLSYYQQLQTESMSPGQFGRSLMGVTSPKNVNYSDAEQTAYNIYMDKQNALPRTPKNALMGRLYKEMESSPEGKVPESLQEAFKKGEISFREYKNIVKSHGVSFSERVVNHGTADEAIAVYDKATPEERSKLTGFLNKKRIAYALSGEIKEATKLAETITKYNVYRSPSSPQVQNTKPKTYDDFVNDYTEALLSKNSATMSSLWQSVMDYNRKESRKTVNGNPVSWKKVRQEALKRYREQTGKELQPAEQP